MYTVVAGAAYRSIHPSIEKFKRSAFVAIEKFKARS
jgi:hypothetical protein